MRTRGWIEKVNQIERILHCQYQQWEEWWEAEAEAVRAELDGAVRGGAGGKT